MRVIFIFVLMALSCAHPRLRPTCKSQVTEWITPVYETADHQKAGTLQPGEIYRAREAFERARLMAMVEACDDRDRAAKKFVPVRASLDKARAKMEAIEEEAGVVFVGGVADRDLREGAFNLEWRWLDGDRPLTTEEEARL